MPYWVSLRIVWHRFQLTSSLDLLSNLFQSSLKLLLIILMVLLDGNPVMRFISNHPGKFETFLNQNILNHSDLKFYKSPAH